MSSLPRVTPNDFVEMAGVIHIAGVVNSAQYIWRETHQRDIGIDGQIEYVTPEGFSPGRLVAAQVKSGASYFLRSTDVEVPFSPEKKHRRYWAEFPFPVILILHNPESHETIWTDARQSLRIHGIDSVIRVPRANVFDAEGVSAALRSVGPLPTGAFDSKVVVAEMAVQNQQAQGLSFLDVFAQGMTDIASSVYFSMDVLDQILDVKAASWNPPNYGVGEAEHSFVDRYVDFLVAHDLARIDYASWKQIVLERNMSGKFIAPLTAKGREVRDLISAVDGELPQAGDPHARAIRERFVQMLYNPMGFDEVASRQARIEEVRQEIERRAADWLT